MLMAEEQNKKSRNWDEMESEGEEDSEVIGVQGEPKDEGEAKEAAEKESKKNWKELQQAKREEEKRKAANPAIVRLKNERGDYVVSGFQITDRLGEKKEKEKPEAKKAKRAGLFQLASDEEEEEEEAKEEEEE